MRPHLVEVPPPVFEREARLAKRGEQRLVQKLVAQLAAEAFHERVLRRLAGVDVMPVGLRLMRPGQDGV